MGYMFVRICCFVKQDRQKEALLVSKLLEVMIVGT